MTYRHWSLRLGHWSLKPLMLILVDILLTLLAAGFCVPVAMFGLEGLLSLCRQRGMQYSALSGGARVAVLIRAHNEQAVLGGTLQPLLSTVPARCPVVVVAD